MMNTEIGRSFDVPIVREKITVTQIKAFWQPVINV